MAKLRRKLGSVMEKFAELFIPAWQQERMWRVQKPYYEARALHEEMKAKELARQTGAFEDFFDAVQEFVPFSGQVPRIRTDSAGALRGGIEGPGVTPLPLLTKESGLTPPSPMPQTAPAATPPKIYDPTQLDQGHMGGVIDQYTGGAAPQLDRPLAERGARLPTEDRPPQVATPDPDPRVDEVVRQAMPQISAETRVTDFDPLHPENIPDKFDDKLQMMYLLGSYAGLTPDQISGFVGPMDPTERYTAYMKGVELMTQSSINALTAKPVAVEYQDAGGNPRIEYVNVDRLLNPGLINWGLRTLPGLYKGVIPSTLQDEMTPVTYGRSSEVANTQDMANGLNTPELMDRLRTEAAAKDGSWSRLTSEEPFGALKTGPMGGISVPKPMVADDRKFLMQLMPLMKVTDRMNQLALSLNDNEIKALAETYGWIERWAENFGYTTQDWGKDPNTKEWAPTGALLNDRKTWSQIQTELGAKGLQVTDRVKMLVQLRNAYAGLFAELGGERGRKTEDDVKRAKQMMVNFGETRGATEAKVDWLYEQLIDPYLAIKYGPFHVLDPMVGEIERRQRERQQQQQGGISQIPQNESRIRQTDPSGL